MWGCVTNELGQRETSNRYNVGFDSNASYSFPAAAGSIAARGGLAFAGVNGYPIHSGNQSHAKFSPRIGAAYELKPGTVSTGSITAQLGYSRILQLRAAKFLAS